jgi:hypothetical protein
MGSKMGQTRRPDNRVLIGGVAHTSTALAITDGYINGLVPSLANVPYLAPLITWSRRSLQLEPGARVAGSGCC